MKTEEKILAKALEMFNERGVEYVGLRELAGILGMRVSNITYYFPTKDDLVNRLSIQLYDLNSSILVVKEDLSIEQFLEMMEQVFWNQLKYRCLLVSFVHLIGQNKLIAARYGDTQTKRNTVIRSNLEVLARNGHIRIKNETELEFLTSTIALVARFWISEAAVTWQHLSAGQQINHYIKSIETLLRLYGVESAK